MAAATTDKLLEGGNPGTATTLDGNYTVSDTSVTVASTTNWPTATGIIFAIDEVETVAGEQVRVAGSYNEYVGTVASGTSITNVAHISGSGTDKNYTAGSSTRVYIPVSSYLFTKIKEWGVAEHNQDGTHAAVTATSVATDTISESTPANGVDIDSLNIKDGLVTGGAGTGVANSSLSTTAGDIGGAWKDWTPTLGNISGGTLTFAKYTQIGKTVHYRFKYTMAGANISGTASFTVPVAAFSDASDTASKTPVGTAIYYDTNGGWVRGVVYLSSSTTVATLTTDNVASTYPSLAVVNATTPFTWASGDAINVSGTYEAA